MPIKVHTGVSGDEQQNAHQNGTQAVTRNGFSVTLVLDLTQDVTLDASISEDEVAERAKQLLQGTGLNADVYIGND